MQEWAIIDTLMQMMKREEGPGGQRTGKKCPGGGPDI